MAEDNNLIINENEQLKHKVMMLENEIDNLRDTMQLLEENLQGDYSNEVSESHVSEQDDTPKTQLQQKYDMVKQQHINVKLQLESLQKQFCHSQEQLMQAQSNADQMNFMFQEA